MIAWFARNSVAANLLMVTIIMGGLLSIKTELTLDIFPYSEPDTIHISVPLRGATPEDVELGVATRIEESVQDLQGLDKITSVSREGGTTVILELDSDYDAREVLDDVKGRVDAINTFPSDAEKPIISLSVRKRAVIDVVISGEYSEEEILQFAERVRDDIMRLEGITQAEMSSSRSYEIAIEASQDKLREFDLTLLDLSRAIGESSLDQSAGNLRSSGGDILIRSKGQAYRQTDFETIVVKSNTDGSIIQIKDVAQVNDSFEEESLNTKFNGRPAAIVKVYRVGKQSAIDVARKVRTYIEDRQSTLPVGMELSYWDDDSEILKKRLSILMTSAVQGAVLVILLLALFLRPAIAVWVFVGIPVSFLGAVIVMGAFDISLNIMSAFGFIIVLGIIVDDAIVTGENVYTHMRQKESGIEAAISGTKEVAIPVTFGVLTTIVAFAPLGLLEGRLGTVFSPIPMVVIPALMFSLLESKFVLPAHLKHVKLFTDPKSESGFQRWQRNFADKIERAIVTYYQPVVRIATEHRYTTLALFTGVFLLILALIMSGWTRFVFFPRIEGETATASLTMPIGTSFDVTNRYIEIISAAATEIQDKYRDEKTNRSPIKSVLSVTGSGGGRSTNASNIGRVQFEVTPKEERSGGLTTGELVQEWRRAIGSLPGVESLTFRADFFRPGNPIDIQFSGTSFETLSEVGEKVKTYLATFPTVFEISDSLSDGKEELRIDLTSQGHVLGLSRSDIVSQVGQAFKGVQAQRIQRGRDDIRVIVRLPQDERRTAETLNQMLIETPAGGKVPLSHVATLVPGKGPSKITRIDRYRVLNVTADIEKDKTNMTVLQADLVKFIDELLLQYPSIYYSLEGEAKQQRESFGSLQSGLIAVLFAIYCLLALPLRSYVQPIIIMSVIPFGLIGAVVGHWIMGHDLSILSILGLMALVGVLVNDSLVLVNYVNQRRAQGESIGDAVLNAGVARFRPVLLTSLTTFFGLLPLMLDQSTTAQFLIPMAISLGFGIIFATMITLVMVPANMMIVEDLKSLFGVGRRLAEDATGSGK